MFGFSFEHLIVLGVILIIFGPRRLPELGHTLGKGIRNFKDAMAGIEEAKYRKIDKTEAQGNSQAQGQPQGSPQGSEDKKS